jgi:hypothetical protein
MDFKFDSWTKVFLFIFLAFIWYLIRQSSGYYYISKGLFEVIVVALIIIGGQTILWISRYYMPHITANGFTGSILDRPVLLKDKRDVIWAVFNTGESLEPFHFRGKLATIVLPYSQLHRAGRNFISKTFCRRTPFMKLPPVVYRYLQAHASEFNTDVIYFGKYSEEFAHADPDRVEHEAEIDNLNAQINLRDDLLEGKNDALIEQKKFAEEMTGSQRKWYEFFKRSKDADEEK